MTGQSLEKVQADTERDYFMTSEEAKAYGIIDEVFKRESRKKWELAKRVNLCTSTGMIKVN